MSNSTVSSLGLATQQVVSYVGIFLFITGLVGNPLTLLVLLSLRTFRQSSCAFCLTIMSIVNTFFLFIGLFTFMMINGFAINWLNMSIFYCKFRPFYVQLCVLIFFSCMCLATIDQFLATCSQLHWQQYCNIKLARYILIGIGITSMLHGIPSLLYYNHILSPVTNKLNCVIVNAVFQKYFTSFQLPILTGALPIAIMIIFGILAYRNVQQIAYRTVPLVRRELDKQLTVMVLVQVFYDAIAVIPSAIVSIFTAIYNAPNDSVIAAQLSYISALALIIYYFRFVGSFYIYICVSKRFRQQLIHVLFTIHLNRFHHRIVNNNQIEPHI